MPENGHVMRDVVTSYAQAVDVKLAQWIEDNVTFPSTMVDRIVPAVTEGTLAKIEQLAVVRDPAGVACEPFPMGNKENLLPDVRNGKKREQNWLAMYCLMKR